MGRHKKVAEPQTVKPKYPYMEYIMENLSNMTDRELILMVTLLVGEMRQRELA